MNKKPFKAEKVGFAYMLAGDTGASNTDPYAEKPTSDNQWIAEGPHLMVLLPDATLLDTLPTDPKQGGPYVMWKGTPYADIMVPVGERPAPKRMSRAKKVLARSKKLFDVTVPIGFAARLPSVQRALYLLFNEGYHGASPQSAVRAELCQEAMRLAAILLQHPFGATSASYALSALMCLNAARLPARMNSAGNLASLFDQDRSRWDAKLVQEGLKLLELSATGSELTAYHIEAAGGFRSAFLGHSDLIISLSANLG